MEEDKLIDSREARIIVQRIKETCKSNKNCSQCPFYGDGIQRLNCIFVKGMPEDIDLNTLVNTEV